MSQHQQKGNRHFRRIFVFLLILAMAVSYAVPSFGYEAETSRPDQSAANGAVFHVDFRVDEELIAQAEIEVPPGADTVSLPADSLPAEEAIEAAAGEDRIFDGWHDASDTDAEKVYSQEELVDFVISGDKVFDAVFAEDEEAAAEDEETAAEEENASDNESVAEDENIIEDENPAAEEKAKSDKDEKKPLSAVKPLADIVPFAAATQSVVIGGKNSEPLKAEIFADGRQQVWLYGIPNSGYDLENRQFFSAPTGPYTSTHDASVGWILHLYESNSNTPTWSVGKGDEAFLYQMSQNSNRSSSLAPGNNLVYNGVTASQDGRSATVSMTAKYNGSSSQTIGILLTYHIDPGSRQMPVTVQIVNNTNKNFSKMSFVFAEDSYFGESLYSIGNYNALANMVYVRAGSKSAPGTTGIMSITGSAATPFTNWDIRDWNGISYGEFLRLDQLKNPTTSPGDKDTILAAGWRYNNFNAGNTIEISYYEAWSAVSDIQVLAPAGKTVPPEARVNYEFNIINLTTKAVTTSALELVSQHGWTAKLTGGSQNIVIQPGATATVTAELVVPPDGVLSVADGVKDDLTLTVTANGKKSSGTTTTTIDDDIPALNITKVGQTATEVTFRVDFINYPPNVHDTTVSILDMSGKVLATPALQTTPGFVSGGTFTFPITALTMGQQYMAEAKAQPEIPYPARTTFRIEPVYTVTFDKNANDATDPAPDTKSVIVNDPYGALATTTRDGYMFGGWFTERTGGSQVTADTIVTQAANHTLYAHWTSKPAITVTAVNDSKPYDGSPLSNNEFILGGAHLLSGHHVEAVISGSQTEVGSAANVVGAVVVKDGDGNDVTDAYAITTANGTLTVTANTTDEITITADSDTKTYDGTALVKNSFTTSALPAGVTRVEATAIGSQTNVGSSANAVTTYKLYNGTTEVTAFFTKVKKVDGALTVTANDTDGITITADSDTKTYDGTPLVKNSFANSALPAGVTSVTAVVEGSQTDVGVGENKVKSYKLYNGGTDVTAYFTKVTLADGTLTVTANTTDGITITAGSASKAYDGTALVRNSFTNSVLPAGVTKVEATVTGSQTDVGSSKNEITSYKLLRGDTDVTSFFNAAALVDGTLTVSINTTDAITITAKSDTKKYDGTALTKNDFDTSALPGGITSVEAVVVGSQLNVGSSDNV
ncbi:MAG: InlB B-repeat-containing protein, partial [Clostridiales Family XIII bacterium]|nr:InlB B-repeat-containing protein [Clostridiales Family XIII bacterium]